MLIASASITDAAASQQATHEKHFSSAPRQLSAPASKSKHRVHSCSMTVGTELGADVGNPVGADEMEGS